MRVDRRDRAALQWSGATINEWWIGNSTSAQIRSGDVMKQSSGVIDHAFGGILDRHDAVVRRLGFDFAEHLVDRRERARRREMTELLDRGGFGIRTGRSR